MYFPRGDPAALRTGLNGSVGEIALSKTLLGINFGGDQVLMRDFGCGLEKGFLSVVRRGVE